MNSFVVTVFMEADSKSLYWASALGLHQSHHGAGIDAAGKKRSQRDIRNHTEPNRGQKRLMQFLDDLGIAACDRRVYSFCSYFSCRPVAADIRIFPRRVDRENAARL